MKTAKAKNFVTNDNVSPRLFDNKWLDMLTRTHIAVPVGLFFLYAAGLIIWTKKTTTLGNWRIAGLFLLGWFVFTFIEYMVHRYVYHMEAGSERGKKISYTMHGIHHDFPKDKQRLAMPPLMSVIIGTLLLFIFKLALDQYSFSFLAGFMVGYASYLLVHYAVHIFRPPGNAFKALWTNHAIHHYGDDHILFGVSSPIWDYVFGTLPSKNKGKGAVEVKR
jgi:sterol desaturase/sphingolipid hydroxylase (fatty acid hydroxylase superfamily)